MMLGRNARPVLPAVQPDGFAPRAFRWQGELVRVLSVEDVRTHGTERRFRLCTTGGRFEMSFHSDAGLWYVLRSPTRLGRALCRLDAMPRYALPVWRRRAHRRALAGSGRKPGGGDHADGLALV